MNVDLRLMDMMVLKKYVVCQEQGFRLLTSSEQKNTVVVGLWYGVVFRIMVLES